MVAFGLVWKEYASIRGVAMEPSTWGPTPTFTLFKDAQLTRRARCERRGAAGGLCGTRGQRWMGEEPGAAPVTPQAQEPWTSLNKSQPGLRLMLWRFSFYRHLNPQT